MHHCPSDFENYDFQNDYQSDNFELILDNARFGQPTIVSESDFAPFMPLQQAVADPSMEMDPAFTLQVLQNPDAEITRNVYFEFKVRMLASSKYFIDHSQPVTELYYENNTPVPGGHIILDGQFAIREGVLVVRARIKELSKAHRSQRFRVKVTAGGVSAFSNPIKVLSKTSIVKAHRTGPAAVASAAPVLVPATVSAVAKRSREDDSSSPMEESLQRQVVSLTQIIADQQKLLASQMGETRALQQDVRALSETINSLRDILAGVLCVAQQPEQPACKRSHVLESPAQPLLVIGGGQQLILD
eukprot:TRINITY_DN15926_c0_g1_i1.p1 TRINITY_DN15926_c0_g1~~TRINITY_DN15926_c0_g1_i1.p1  ORF type:complete len:302 (+),score=39.64 TRINITY_DN15926_c0_g1_i1:120-1025(+)